MLDALAKQRASTQPVEEWKQEVQKKFQKPSLSVNNYSGGDVNVIGQLPVALQVENRNCLATILVQKGANVDLLLGTDLIPELGFLVLEAPGQKGQSMDLIQKKDEGSCNTSSMNHMKENPLLDTLTQSQAKDSTNEIAKSEERNAEEATEGASKDASKRVTEKEGGAGLEVSHIILALLLPLRSPVG